ncbi:RING-type E3 ubiquitin transferase [Ranunculus cassubicifolius]
MSSTATAPPPPTAHDPHKDAWYPYSNGAHFDGNLAMILIFVFCALICALAMNAGIRFFLRLSREERQNQASAVDSKPSQTSLSVLSSLPTLVFSSGMKIKLAGGGEEAECAICLSEFVNGESVRILPKCKHGFHVKCIEGWLSSHLSCPTCRTICASLPRKEGDQYDVESTPPAQVVVAQADRGS